MEQGFNRKKDAFKFSAIEFTYWFAMSIGGYLVVFLQERGYTASMAGFISSLNLFVGIFSTLFWGVISDKLRSVKKVLLITLSGTVLFSAMIPFSADVSFGSFSLVLLIVPLAFFFRTPANSLLDNWVIRSTNERKMNYGIIRACGSFSFAIIGIIISFILPYTGVDCTFWVSSLFLIPVILLCYSVKDDVVREKSRMRFSDLPLGSLFGNYYYMTFLAFMFFLNVGLNCSYTFLSYLLADIGAETTRLGLVTGYRALLEIPMLLLLKPLRNRIPLYYMMFASAFLYALEFYCFGVAQSMTQVVLFTSFHGLGAGLMFASAANYIFLLAPGSLKATAQTVYVAVTSVAGIIGTALGGVIVDQIGVRRFYSYIGVWISAALVLYLLSFAIGKRVLKKPAPGKMEE